jgi:signal transduction histidine kinase/tetratricopeptide (TPR) repeat protein
MGRKKKPLLRLTIFFISVVLVSGSILAYLSINNISNLKELTEKRVQEEQKILALELGDQIEEEIIELAEKFSDSADGKGLDQLAAIRSLDTLELIGNIFITDRKGNFLWPWFIEGLGNSTTRVLAKSYHSNFDQAERAEFIEEDFSKANRIYLASLKISANNLDSVQALNALARLSVKMGDHPLAFKYYSTLISNYHDLCDPNGFPYAYYAIPQLLRISNESNRNEVLMEVKFCISGMISGKIPLNYSTQNLLDRVKAWIDPGIEPLESSIPLHETIQTIEKRLSFVDRNRDVIQKHISGDRNFDTPVISGGYHLLNTSLKKAGEILLASFDEEYATGCSIPIEPLWEKLSGGDFVSDTEFEYELDLVQMKNDIKGAELPLTTSVEISPYFPGYYVLIKMKNESLIDEFVRRRSWIFGIAFTLLLGGMILGILLILRDISREEQLARLRADFISNVTHELKTPLTSIQLFTESMVLKRIKSEENKRDYLNIILRETESLKRMINNILDFSRKGKGRREYHFEEVNISALVHTAIKDLEYWLVEKNFKLFKEIEDNVIAAADPSALKQAIINLLNNAIKFSVDRKEITVRLQMEDKHILIQVEDKGIGIPDDQKNLIFQPFYRVGQEHAEDISGTGLGLSVVKEIVEAHQGEISVNSQLNQGSNFTIRINTHLENLE